MEHREPNFDVIKEVIESKSTVFDVLPQFFAHDDPWVSLAALEVYIRRAYRAYELKMIKYHNDDEPPFVLCWDFVLHKIGQAEFGLPIQSSYPSTPSTWSNCAGGHPKRIQSLTEAYLVGRTAGERTRKGAVVPVPFLDDADEYLMKALETFPSHDKSSNSLNDLNVNSSSKREPTVPKIETDDELASVCVVAVRDAESFDDQEIVSRINTIINKYRDELLARQVHRLTFICGHKDDTYPGYYTFRGPAYNEDLSIRHVEPALAFQLELGRLSNFNVKPVFTENRNIHIYEAIAKSAQNDKRYFARAVVQPKQLNEEIPTAEYMISEADRVINDILDALEIIGNNNSDMNHIFINFAPIFPLGPIDIKQALESFLNRCDPRAWRLRITTIEVRILCVDTDTSVPYPIRVVINNTSGFIVQVELYVERKSDRGSDWVFHSIDGTTKVGSMHLRSVSTPYPTKGALQPKRYKAHIMGTQYVYDFPKLFKQAIENNWIQAVAQNSNLKEQQPANGECTEYNELVLDEHDDLVEVNREPGTNTIGMVGWIVTAKTPEYPHGRRFIIVANDITYKIGTFGPREGKFFHKCSELARRLGIPRIYLSANSGARFGVAEELVPHLSIAWNDINNPEFGFRYLYLTPETKKRFEDTGRRDVITEEIKDDDEVRYKITTIIGAEDGLGVECLKSSGLIAGETSRAYDDIFTISLVTCRSIGE